MQMGRINNATTNMNIKALMAAMLACSVSAVPFLSNDCGNGISCAPDQTCMSNATGAGLLYACSPLPDAVRCMDARFSCPAATACAENATCTATATTATPTATATTDKIPTDAVINVDAHRVADVRDFGAGMKPTSFSICGAITGTFRLPNFCTCRDARLGGELGCTIGLQTFITIGASAWVLPCAPQANVGYRAWVSVPGVITHSIGQTWTAAFTVSQPIPGAHLHIGGASAGARAELSGNIARQVISTRLAIGACARLGVGPFAREICNPSMLPWLPVTVINGPRFDFSRFC
jgi:hypothetical protein